MHVLIILCNFLLVCCLRSHADHDVDPDINYPPLWDTAPSSFIDYPLVNDAASPYRSIDPWLYPHRLGLYKMLINVTTPLMPFCSSSNASNILFALPSQFGWQFESNRLFTNGTLNISASSWWASGNYYLSVIPFLAAMDVGLIPSESVRIVQHEDFCANSSACFEQAPRAMKQWHSFFAHLQRSTKQIDERTIDQHYLRPMWLAYQSSIEDAMPLIEPKAALLPSQSEQMFGRAWARLIRLIAMTRKNTDLYETVRNQRRFLPPRMLSENDQLASPNDLADPIHRSLLVIFSFRFSWLTQLEKIWSKVTCNYEGRLYAQHTLESLPTSKMLALKNLTRAIFRAFLFPCDPIAKNDL